MAGLSRRSGVVEEAINCGFINEIRQRPNQRREELAKSLNLPQATLHRLIDGLHSLNVIDIISGKIKLKSPMYNNIINNNNIAWSNTQPLPPPPPPHAMMQHIPGGGGGPPPPYSVYPPPPFISMPPYHPHNTTIHTSSPYEVSNQGGQSSNRGRQGNSYMTGNDNHNQYQLPHGGPPLPQQQQQYYNYNYNYAMPSSGAVVRLNHDGTPLYSSYTNNNNNNNMQQQGPMYPSVTYSSTPGTGGGENIGKSGGQGIYSTSNSIDEEESRSLQGGGGSNNNDVDSAPCAFFLKTGTCAWGDNCRFAHPYDLAPEPKFNSMGLPVRLDQPNCVFYMKTGRCSFGFTCKYNHPDRNLVVGGGGGGGYSINNNNNNSSSSNTLGSMALYGYGGSVAAISGGGMYQYGIGAPPKGGLPRMAPPPRRKQPVFVSSNGTIEAVAAVVDVSGERVEKEVKEANSDDGGSGEEGVERETEEGDNQDVV